MEVLTKLIAYGEEILELASSRQPSAAWITLTPYYKETQFVLYTNKSIIH